AVARLHLLEQPCVLDGDDGLIRKSLQDRDLLFGKGVNHSATKHYAANSGTFSQKWNAQGRTMASQRRNFAPPREVLPRGKKIMYMNRLSVDHGPARNPIPSNRLPNIGKRHGHIPVMCRRAQIPTVPKEYCHVSRSTKPTGGPRDSVERRLQIKFWTACNLKNGAWCRLIFMRPRQ